MLRKPARLHRDHRILLNHDACGLIADELAGMRSDPRAATREHAAEERVAEARLFDRHKSVVSCVERVCGPVAVVAVYPPDIRAR